MKSREVLAAVVRTGASSRDFFGTAQGQKNGHFEGFQFGKGVESVDDTMLLIEPEVARQYASDQEALIAVARQKDGKSEDSGAIPDGGVGITGPVKRTDVVGPGPAPVVKMKSFRGSVEVDASLAKSQLNTLADEVIKWLASDPNATVRITLEIDAEFPNGASDNIKRSVSENATILKFKTKDWE